VSLQLARGRFWQLGYEFHRARILVWRDGVLHMLLQLARERVAGDVARIRDDVSLDDLSALLVASTDHGAFPHSRMLKQRGLHFRPGDVVAARDAHGVSARLEPEEAVALA